MGQSIREQERGFLLPLWYYDKNHFVLTGEKQWIE